MLPPQSWITDSLLSGTGVFRVRPTLSASPAPGFTHRFWHCPYFGVRVHAVVIPGSTGTLRIRGTPLAWSRPPYHMGHTWRFGVSRPTWRFAGQTSVPRTFTEINAAAYPRIQVKTKVPTKTATVRSPREGGGNQKAAKAPSNNANTIADESTITLPDCRNSPGPALFSGSPHVSPILTERGTTLHAHPRSVPPGSPPRALRDGDA